MGWGGGGEGLTGESRLRIFDWKTDSPVVDLAGLETSGPGAQKAASWWGCRLGKTGMLVLSDYSLEPKVSSKSWRRLWRVSTALGSVLCLHFMAATMTLWQSASFAR